MKVALCISGLMRTYKETSKSVVRHICQRYDTDIFVSTWSILGKSVSKFSRQSTDDLVSKFTIHNVYPNLTRELAIDDYSEFKANNNHNWCKEKYEWTKANNREGICRVEHLFAMCYKIKHCNAMKNEYAAARQVHYDCVIRCRADLLFNRTLKIVDIKPNTIYTPSIDTWNRVNDQFAYGDAQAMDIYSSLYNHIEEYDKINGMNITCPEMVLQHHLKVNNITQIEVNVPYTLIRF